MAATASWQPSLHDNGADVRRGVGLGQRSQSYRREDQKHELMMTSVGGGDGAGPGDVGRGGGMSGSVGDRLSGFTEGRGS